MVLCCLDQKIKKTKIFQGRCDEDQKEFPQDHPSKVGEDQMYEIYFNRRSIHQFYIKYEYVI